MSTIERETTETQVVTRSDILHRAADLIEEWGWGCGVGSDPYATKDRGMIPLCILGATYRARVDFGDVPPLGVDLYVWAAESLEMGAIEASFFNDYLRDSPDGKEQVVRKLRDLAELSELSQGS